MFNVKEFISACRHVTHFSILILIPAVLVTAYGITIGRLPTDLGFLVINHDLGVLAWSDNVYLPVIEEDVRLVNT